MKKLLYKILKKIVSIILIIVLIIIMSFIIKSNTPFYIDKYKKEIVFKNKIEVGIFGDSEIHAALDSKIITKKIGLRTNNLAVGGQTVFMNVLKVRDLLKYNPNVIIIFDYGSNNISYRGNMIKDEGAYFDEPNYRFSVSNNYQFMKMKEIIFFCKKFPFETLQSILKGTFSYNHILHSGIDKNINSKIENSIKHIEIVKREKDSISNSIHYIKEDYQFEKLHELINQNPKTKFILFNPPEHELNEFLYKEDSLKRKYYLNEFRNFENVFFINLKKLELENKDFEDFSHLTISGLEKTSLITSKILNKMIK